MSAKDDLVNRAVNAAPTNGPRYFLRVATPVAKDDCMRVLANAWTALTGAPPKDDAVRLMCAHWGVETTWGKKGYCYNLANMRTPSKYDYTYISGNEKINGRWEYFDQDHPSKMARFRAFHTPQEAANAYVDLLSRIHKRAFAVLQGSCDVTDFSRALSKQLGTGYYTDDVDHYTRALASVHAIVKSLSVPGGGAVTGYAVLAPDPRGDPSTWPRDQVAGESPPAPAPEPSSFAAASESPGTTEARDAPGTPSCT